MTINEREPFPAFLATLTALELAAMRHDAIRLMDAVTKSACDDEFKRRVHDAADAGEGR